jgi:protoporphyrinogen/coproporphyrinogen III oxidase
VLDRGARNLTEAVREALPPPKAGSVFGAIDGGYQVLLDELIRRADVVWAQVGIDRVERAGSGWQLIDDEGSDWHADAVLLAVPAPRLARIVAGVAPRTAAAARQVAVASTALVALALPGGAPVPDRSGVLVTASERLHAKAIRLSFGRYGDDIAHRVGDDDLLSWAAEDLATVFGVTSEPFDCLVHRWIDAMPQYGPGHGGLVAELRAGLPPSLAAAGAYLDGIGVPACIAAATRAAASLVSSRVEN